jgi:hydroxypyruvate reductase
MRRGRSATDSSDALADNDALAPLSDADCAIRTGPTGTNINDLRMLIIGDRRNESGS